MGLFGQSIFREFDEPENGYYFQAFVERPSQSRIKYNPLRVWYSERDALLDLSYIIPRYVERDKEPDSLIIKDASLLNRYIYIVKAKLPTKVNQDYAEVDDIEKDRLKELLSKNNIVFKVKLQNNLATASRNKVVNIALNSLRANLRGSEFSKCVEYKIKTNDDYSRFVAKVDNSLSIATYDAHKGIPNPRNNVQKLNEFYTTLHDAVDKTNVELLRMGYKLEIFGQWDRGWITLEILSSSLGESAIIYEDPSTLKINGQPVDDEDDEDDDNNKYSINDEPEEDNDDTPDEEENTEEEEEPSEEENTEEDTPDEGDEPEEDEGTDEAPNDYRINTDDDTEEETPDEEENTDEPEEEGEDNTGGEENDTPTDYRINDTNDDDNGDDTPDEGDGGDTTTDDTPNDYRINTDDAGGETDDTSTDDGGEATPDDTGDGDTGGGDDTPDEGGDTGDAGGDGPTDYRVSDTDSTDDTSGDEGDSGDTTDDTGESEETGEEDNNENKEDEIFSNMSPEQKKIQDMELKDNYIKLYNAIGDLISRIDSIVVDNSNREAVAFVQNQLNEMKEMVYKYLTEVYSTKTYIENNVTYEQYLVILSNINNLLVQLNVKSSDVD